MRLLLIATGDTFPQEKFEGHGFIWFAIFMALLAILWGILSGRND